MWVKNQMWWWHTWCIDKITCRFLKRRFFGPLEGKCHVKKINQMLIRSVERSLRIPISKSNTNNFFSPSFTGIKSYHRPTLQSNICVGRRRRIPSWHKSRHSHTVSTTIKTFNGHPTCDIHQSTIVHHDPYSERNSTTQLRHHEPSSFQKRGYCYGNFRCVQHERADCHGKWISSPSRLASNLKNADFVCTVNKVSDCFVFVCLIRYIDQPSVRLFVSRLTVLFCEFFWSLGGPVSDYGAKQSAGLAGRSCGARRSLLLLFSG